MNPTAVTRLFWHSWQTAVAAQTTIALRLWSLSTPAERDSAWGRAEMVRMVSEKQAAGIASAFAMQQAMLRAAATPAVLAAALRPYRQKTRANAKRLTRRVRGRIAQRLRNAKLLTVQALSPRRCIMLHKVAYFCTVLPVLSHASQRSAGR